MNRKDKLHIAKEAYKIVSKAIQHAESYQKAEIHCCWDECIWVDDEFFQYRELREDDDQGD